VKSSPIIVAMDFPSVAEILDLANRLDPSLCRLKIGFEAFLRGGPSLVEQLHAMNFDIFLDLKFHDIPNTVAAACRAAAEMGVWMMNVHASGGEKMISAAREALDSVTRPPLLIAVTVLTSMSRQDLSGIGLNVEPGEQVLQLANLAKQSGADGVVCSAREAVDLRTSQGDDFLLVTPGIRPVGSDSGDQHRIMTPEQAVQAGSNYLVIGRPITQASQPVELLNEILVTLS